MSNIVKFISKCLFHFFLDNKIKVNIYNAVILIEFIQQESIVPQITDQSLKKNQDQNKIDLNCGIE